MEPLEHQVPKAKLELLDQKATKDLWGRRGKKEMWEPEVSDMNI